MELLMMLDIAKGAAAQEIHAIIPYFSYARSDKKDAPRISITARLVADLLATAGATHIMTMQLHSPQVHGFFSMPADPLAARGLMADYLRRRRFSHDDTVVVSPDMGSAKSAARFADMLGLGVATANKTRLSDTRVQYSGLIVRQVSGYRRAIIHDDEIATGGTIVELTRLLVENGLEEVFVICTHGLFLRGALELLEATPQIKEIVTTDTVPQVAGRPDSKLTVLSTGPIFAGAIRQNYFHRSIGDLFDFGDHTTVEE
jgi:ribose-phosphate pyrophosphokinase